VCSGPAIFTEQADIIVPAPVGAVSEAPPLVTYPLPADSVTLEGPPTASDDVTTRDFDSEIADGPTSVLLSGVPSNAFSGVLGAIAAAALLLV
jgi:hypothetical protein